MVTVVAKIKKKKPRVRLHGLFWIYRLISICSVTDLQNIILQLNESETAKASGDRLQLSWLEELHTHNNNSIVRKEYWF
jgi:hypothetical protein